MEHRAGFEPADTGFAGEKNVLFQLFTENVGHSKSLKGIEGNLHHELKMGWSFPLATPAKSHDQSLFDVE